MIDSSVVKCELVLFKEISLNPVNYKQIYYEK